MFTFTICGKSVEEFRALFKGTALEEASEIIVKECCRIHEVEYIKP